MKTNIRKQGVKKQSAYYDSYEADKSYIISVWANISKFIKGQVLDIGGSNGQLLDCMKKIEAGSIVDIAPITLKKAQLKGYKAIYSDMHHLPFVDKSFDTVLLINTLEHSSNPLQLLHEVKRVLKNEGKVILDVPNSRSFRQITNLLFRGDPIPSGNSPLFMESPNHYFQYSSIILYELLLSQGFDEVKVSGKSPIQVPFKQFYSLLPESVGKIIATDIIGVGKKP
jgi:SAM-dependent methyltransferase|tara:strand:+ start:785 stop:1462 length:678 start_codon:yes stop_codon:yes gene_type:complete